VESIWTFPALTPTLHVMISRDHVPAIVRHPALFMFPWLGHALGMSQQQQFGLWAVVSTLTALLVLGGLSVG